MGIIYVVQEEREIKEKRDKETRRQRERGLTPFTPKLHHRLRGAEAREICAQLIKRLNEVIKSVAFFIQLPLVKNN